MFPVVCVQWRQHADLLLKMNWALAACVIMSSQRRQWGRMPATKCIHSGRLVTRAGSHSNMQRHSSHAIRWAKWAPWAEHAGITKPWFGDVCELWRAEMYSVTPKRGTHDLTMAHHVLCRQCPLFCLELSLFIHLTICLYVYISYCSIIFRPVCPCDVQYEYRPLWNIDPFPFGSLTDWPWQCHCFVNHL